MPQAFRLLAAPTALAAALLPASGAAAQDDAEALPATVLPPAPQWRAAFERRLAADPAFAAEGDARLHWIMDNGPHADPWHHIYPVRREL